MVDTCPEFLSHMEKVQWQNQQMLLADRAVHLQDVQHLLADNLRKVAGLPPSAPTTEDNMIHIGDIINQPPTIPPAPPGITSPVQGPAPASLISRIAPALVGAGLLATGAGAGVGIPMLWSALTQKTTSSPTPPVVSPPPIVQEWDNSIKMTVTPP